MKNHLILAWCLVTVGLITGCETIPPGAERGPHGTIAYDVLVEASEPGARIEADGNFIGTTPVHLKIFGDTDGTFHDFGSYQYVIQAQPISTNQFAQVRAYGTGRNFYREDHIPKHIYFDMNQRPSPPPQGGPPAYVYPDYGPPPAYYYYGPEYYGPRFYFGPSRHWR